MARPIPRKALGACVALVAASVTALAAPGLAAAAVTASGNSASIDTFQALNSVDTQSQNKQGNDFISFTENLLPSLLTGPEGRAKAFVSQASAVVTQSQTFPLLVTEGGFVVDGRLLDQATKSSNPAPGVPVASSEGSVDMDFDTSALTPFQFAGSLLSSNTDADDCTEVSVKLTGPVNHTFEASAGGDCSPSLPHSRGFVVTNNLPAGSYTLSVEYSTTVDPEDPGSESASAAVDTSLAFFPPNTRLTRARINRRLGKATFKFKKVGNAKGFECRLIRRGHKPPKFRKCRSPKTYRNLGPGRYTFEVRVVGAVAPDATPVRKRFRIPK